MPTVSKAGKAAPQSRCMSSPLRMSWPQKLKSSCSHSMSTASQTACIQLSPTGLCPPRPRDRVKQWSSHTTDTCKGSRNKWKTATRKWSEWTRRAWWWVVCGKRISWGRWALKETSGLVEKWSLLLTYKKTLLPATIITVISLQEIPTSTNLISNSKSNKRSISGRPILLATKVGAYRTQDTTMKIKLASLIC